MLQIEMVGITILDNTAWLAVGSRWCPSYSIKGIVII